MKVNGGKEDDVTGGASGRWRSVKHIQIQNPVFDKFKICILKTQRKVMSYLI